mgnify:CR=1 FL=1
MPGRVRVRVVAASRAAKRWRDASEIVAVILCNLGGLRFGLGFMCLGIILGASLLFLFHRLGLYLHEFRNSGRRLVGRGRGRQK